MKLPEAVLERIAHQPGKLGVMRFVVSLTDEGTRLVADITPLAHAVTSETLAPLSAGETERLIELLEKLR